MKKIILTLLVIISAVCYAQQKRAMTVDDLWAMKRVGEFDVSPDGSKIVYVVKEYSMEENSGQSDIWTANSDGTDFQKILASDEDETQPRFSPSGDKILYKFYKQIWQCNLDGTDAEQLTFFYAGADNCRTSGNNILFTAKVYPDCESEECNRAKDRIAEQSKANVKIFDELMYRHWDDWRGVKRNHLFLFIRYNEVYTDLTLNSQADVPPLALGSSNDYNYSPDGKEVVFTTNESDFLASSTNNDVFILDISNASNINAESRNKISVSEGNDNHPIYSADGNYIAFLSMARAGFESDKKSLMIYNRASKELSNLTENLDISIGEFVWSPDSKTIYFIADNEIYNSIYSIDLTTGFHKLLLKETYAQSLIISTYGDKIYFKVQNSMMPDEIFSYDLYSSELKQITYVNKELLAELDMMPVETFWSEGAEGAKVQSILVKPPRFDKDKKYPMIFLIHGGPQGHWSDDFHYRWNLQMFASQGHVVVAPNPRGSTGYGQKFTDEISRDWNGKVYTDLMNAYNYAIEEFEFIDSNNTFAAGASYGGYMINWIEGHNTKFNALFSHDGTYNLESFYGSTEELWFPEWDLGGTPWENKDMYDKWSPSSYVANFKTPMMVVHGGKDYRIPDTQAFELFTALQKMGVESRFVYFPEENHFVLKPQNARVWWSSMFSWFEKYYKR